MSVSDFVIVSIAFSEKWPPKECSSKESSRRLFRQPSRGRLVGRLGGRLVDRRLKGSQRLVTVLVPTVPALRKSETTKAKV